MTQSTEQDIVELLRHTAGYLINDAVEDGAVSTSMLCEAADLITQLRAAAHEAERWKGVAKIEAEGRLRMTELGQQAHDRALVAARDMRERCAKVADDYTAYSGHGCEGDNDLIGMFARGNRNAKRRIGNLIRSLPSSVIATEGSTS